MKIVKPNIDAKNSYEVKIFLAGSIEMGKAEDWQKIVSDRFNGGGWNITFFNPRRDEWDPSWTQEQKNEKFNHQVNWELNHLEESDIIFMYFSPGTKSLISLLELGAFGSSGKIIVCCPPGLQKR